MLALEGRSSVRLTQLEHALAGAGSGAVTRCICQPFDVLKIRFQIQTEVDKGQTKPKYRGIAQATRIIFREEGFQAFWKGHFPAQILSVAHGAVQFTSYELFKRLAYFLDLKSSSNSGHLLHFISGVCAGVTATAATFPLDVMRTFLVAQGEPKIHSTLYEVGSSIAKKSGLGGFFMGLFPAAVQVAPYTGLQFGFYSIFSRVLVKDQDNMSTTLAVITSLTSGALSGTAAETLVYPLDVTKKRMQVQNIGEMRAAHFGEVKQYKGLMHCISSTFRHEGVHGLFKGYVASLWKAALYSVIQFCSYEQLCLFLHRQRLKELEKVGD